MKILMILLSGVILVNNHSIDKTQLEAITGTKVVKQGIVPVVAKKETSKVKTTKKATKKKVVKKNKKKVVKKAKKKVVKKKSTKKKKSLKRTYVRFDRIEIQIYAYGLVKSYGWSDYDFDCLVKLWNRESSWNPNAVNPISGACGVPQSLPCSKMKSEGADYRTNYKTQVRWGLNYIKARYGSPANAWGHSQRKGWY